MTAAVPEDVLDAALAEKGATPATAIESVCAGHTAAAVHIALAMVFGGGLADVGHPDAVMDGFARSVAAELFKRQVSL